MADNVALPAVTGTVAADEVVDGTLGTVKVQYVKIMDATLDGTTKAAVGAAGLKVDGSGATQPVSQTDTTASGSLGVLNATVTLTTSGKGSSTFQIAGTWVGTITFQSSNDAFATTVNVAAVYLNGAATQSATWTSTGTNVNGNYSVITAGFAQTRAIMTAYTSGTATIVAEASLANRIVVPVQGNANNLLVKVSDGTNAASVFPAGFIRTTDEPSQLFYDPFDGSTLDTVNRWSVLYGSGGLLPTQSAGQLTVDAGSTSGGFSTLYAQNALTPTVPAWLGVSFALNLTDGASLVSTGYRFWGVATIPGPPTIAAPITDGVGFEVTGGKMYAVVYAAGVRTVIQDLSAATGNALAPTDALNHRYIVYVRTDKTYWYIDTLTNLVATSNFQSPSVQTLPIRFLSISGGSSTQLLSPGIAAWDTGKNNTQISDGTYPWRKVAVSAAGGLKVDGSAVTQPVSIASAVPVTIDSARVSNQVLMQKLLILQGQGSNGFIPIETPAFLVG